MILLLRGSSYLTSPPFLLNTSVRRLVNRVVRTKVLAEWNGIWWNAEITGVTDRDYLVVYENSKGEWTDRVMKSSDRIVEKENDIEIQPLGSTQPIVASDRFDFEGPSSKSSRIGGPRKRESMLPMEIGPRMLLSARLRDGRLVFKDSETGILSWVPTASDAKPRASTMQTVIPELPAGFISRKDPVGREYFFNSINHSSQYEKPNLSAKEVATNMKKAEGIEVKSISPWEIYFDVDGNPFLSNPETGEVTWNLRPKTAKSKESLLKPALRPGWQVHYTDDGFPYYFCEATGESHWELPSEDWWVDPAPHPLARRVAS